MKVKYTFIHMDHSDQLKSHTDSKLEKLKKFELKPLDIEFHFSHNKNDYHAEMNIYGKNLKLNASANGKDHFSAVDQVINKMGRQLWKHKHKMQYHKKKPLSHEGEIERLSPDLGLEEPPYKKVN